MNIFFRDIGKTESLDAYLSEKVGSTIESFLKYDENASVTIRIELDRHRTQGRKPSFNCEIILKPTHQKGTIKVHKNGEDFYSAVNAATAALRAILRRRSTRKAQHRRHEHDRELKDLVA